MGLHDGLRVSNRKLKIQPLNDPAHFEHGFVDSVHPSHSKIDAGLAYCP
jgi:hypothetical protein